MCARMMHISDGIGWTVPTFGLLDLGTYRHCFMIFKEENAKSFVNWIQSMISVQVSVI